MGGEAGERKVCRLVGRDEIDQMLRENVRDLEKSRQMTAASEEGRRFAIADPVEEFQREWLERRPQLDHERAFYPHGTVIKQGQRGWFYRGERKVYPRSVPTLLRRLEGYAETRERELYRVVADMRIAEFAMLVDHFEVVREWDQCDVLYELLAQHYGLETSWLDVTNDFNTALFFATCKYENGDWRPLREEDFTDEDSRYGVIFRARYERLAMRLGMTNVSAMPGEPRPTYSEAWQNVPLPIGYQPFLRCTFQMGYGIHMRTPMPLQEDWAFEELRFEHDPKLSEAVFEGLDGGKAIYPDEGIEAARWHIDQIAHATTFSEEAFGYALVRSHLYRKADREACLRDLSSFEVDGNRIVIGSHPVRIGKSRILDVDAQ